MGDPSQALYHVEHIVSHDITKKSCIWYEVRKRTDGRHGALGTAPAGSLYCMVQRGGMGS